MRPTHQIVGVFDRRQYIEQLTARITRRARLNWHNDQLLAKATPGDTVVILSPQGRPTRIQVTELQIKVADHLVSSYASLEEYIAEEIEMARHDAGYTDGEQYVLEEVKAERGLANAVVIHEQGGFRDVRAVPIAEAA